LLTCLQPHLRVGGGRHQHGGSERKVVPHVPVYHEGAKMEKTDAIRGGRKQKRSGDEIRVERTWAWTASVAL
jgi:hypothetical protein